jgi:hypothetical protein
MTWSAVVVYRAGAAACRPSRAGEVKSATADGFAIEHQAQLPFPPVPDLRRPGPGGLWWNDEHTFSGKAPQPHAAAAGGRLLLRALARSAASSTAGCCTPATARCCAAKRARPLQDMALTGSWRSRSRPRRRKDGGTALLLSYRVHGPAGQQLDKLAPVVDGVLGDSVRPPGQIPAEPGKAK